MLPWKTIAINIYILCFEWLIIFFLYELLIGPQPHFSTGMLGYFPVIRLANFVQVAAVVVVAL